MDEIDRKAAQRTAGERAEREKMSRPAPAQPARKTGLSATVIVMSVVAAAICGCGGILLLPGLLNPVTPLPYDYPTEAFADFPTASPTEIPSVEPPPTDAPTFEIPSTGEDAVILHDIFDDNSNGWYMRSGETEFAIDNTEISDGVFIWDIQETKTGFVAYETYPNAQILENFYVSVNVMLLSVPQQCLLWDSVPFYEYEQVSL